MSTSDLPKWARPSSTVTDVATGGLAVPWDPSINTGDDTPSGQQRRRQKAGQDQQDAINKQNAQDAANQADADKKTNAARLELLSRQGFGSTVLTGPGLLGRQSTLGA